MASTSSTDTAAIAGPMVSDSETTEELKRALRAQEGGKKWLARLILVAAVVAIVAAGLVIRAKNKPPAPSRYVVSGVTRGDVSEKVQATGAVQPLLSVNVGSQVNGRVTRVLVDFNSLVKKGDVLAEIDPTIYGAQVNQGQASLVAQRAQVESQRATSEAFRLAFERVQKLQAQGLASQGEVDAARGQFDASKAQVNAASAQANAIAAQLVQSQSNVAFTKLYAPVDGVVISRAIDPGATVVASFQTSTLFVIAQDLKRMRIMADVDEADVGKLRAGMDVDTTVDAFPGEVFSGKVQQVRYSPNNVQGVVTYAAVVEVANPDEKLRPGMTATVTVRTSEAKAVVKVPNAALRYKPSPPTGPDGKPVFQAPETPLAKGKGRIYILTDATLGEEKSEPRIVDTGITDGINTVVSGVEDSVKVVTDETDEGEKKKKGRVI
jgi:HlyD family secretion protein